MNFKDRESKQKLRGGYYTPMPLAAKLTQWALADGAQTLLEPSCGDGSFLQAIDTTWREANSTEPLAIDAVELIPEEAAKAESSAISLRSQGVAVNIVQSDFFHWFASVSEGKLWQAIVGNPPYIRYQYFDSEQRELAAQIFAAANVPFSKRTNAWVPFIIASVMRLAKGGRLAMVVPAELLHIMHAEGLRLLLEQEMESITLVHVREMVFPDALQGILLILGVKRRDRPFQPLRQERHMQPSLFSELPSTGADIKIVDVNTIDEVTPQVLDIDRAGQNGGSKQTRGEWMAHLLNAREFELLREIRSARSVPLFAEIADVDIGIVTGANSYFVVDEDTVAKYDLGDIALPMLAKSELIKGITYRCDDHIANARAGKSVYFLNFPAIPLTKLPPKMVDYIHVGEEEELPRRYKCRIRDPWYAVPYVWTAEIALLKRCHLFPRLALNEFGAYSTDTAYRVRMRHDYAGRAKELVFSFLNSLTFLCAEIAGRHYAGGVLELVPTEIESLLVPIRPIPDSIFGEVDRMIRQSATLENIVHVTDPLILGEGLGLTSEQIDVIRGAHRRLLARRLRSDGLTTHVLTEANSTLITTD